MSFSVVTEWTLFRSLLLALLASPVCLWLERGLRTSSRKTICLWLLVLPFLFPELLLGYLIAPFVMGRPWHAEFACCAVLFLRSVPVGVVALTGSPASAVSPAAIFVRRLKLQTLHDVGQLGLCYWHGPVRRMLPAWGLMFLTTFQDFEASALLGAASWTDRLFTEFATGLPLAESGRYLIPPLVIQLAVLTLVGWGLWRRTEGTGESDVDGERPTQPVAELLAERFALGVFLIGVAGPLLLLSRELSAGWTWLIRQPSAAAHLAEEICTAGLVSLVAGLAAWTIGQTTKSRILLLTAVPGLCGGLTVSLAMLWLSTHLFPDFLATTPVAWVLALVIWLLPRALLVQLWLQQQTDSAAMHLAALLRDSPDRHQRQTGQRWQWRWRVEPQIATVGLLCYWAYLDLTTAALLAPPGLASVVVRLYNFMHFGHSAAMTMEAAIVMILPALLWGVMMAAARRACELA
jgi:iron(III) transport system permease protein